MGAGARRWLKRKAGESPAGLPEIRLRLITFGVKHRFSRRISTHSERCYLPTNHSRGDRLPRSDRNALRLDRAKPSVSDTGEFKEERHDECMVSAKARQQPGARARP